MFSESRLLYNLEAEQALLGAMLFRNSVILQVAGYLMPEHFAEETHQRLYSLMLDDMTNGRTFTPITMAPRLGLIGAGDMKAGPYLVGLLSMATSVVYPQEFAEQIVELAAQRNLQAVCRETLASLESPDASSTDLTAETLSALQDISGSADLSVFKTEEAVGIEILESLSKPLVCTSTGFPRLDQAMGGGMYPGCVYGFMGRFKSGKTLFASTISDNLSRREQQVKHVYFALEMGANAIHQRKLARRMEVWPSRFRDPNHRSSTETWNKCREAIEKTPSACIYANTPGVAFDRLKRLAATAVYRHKIEGFILDYWQLVEGQPRGMSRADHLECVAQWVAEFVKKHQIWAIVLGQINQNGNTRGSEGSQLAFDQVYDICRPDDGGPTAWLEPRASRYTQATAVGCKDLAAYEIKEIGPYFHEYER